MLVREARVDDVSVVAEIHRQAFGDHGDVVAALFDDLRRSLATEPGLSLVAEHDGDVVGNVLFSGTFSTPRLGSSTSRCSAPWACCPPTKAKGSARR